MNDTNHTVPKGGLRGLAIRFLNLFRRVLPKAEPTPTPTTKSRALQPLQRVVLTKEVHDSLFNEFENHRETSRGNEEIGWVLLGIRDVDQVIVQATLPAGAMRDAGKSHVKFNSDAQAVATRILRLDDRRLCQLGVVHTHPGKMRQPSKGDYKGDSQWVGQLPGGEGVFAIGTFEGKLAATIAQQAEDCVQYRGELLFSWYALGEGEKEYRRIPVVVSEGDDRAKDLRELWPIIEEHATRLERLFVQQAHIECRLADIGEKALAVTVPLMESGSSIRLLLLSDSARYFVLQGKETFEVDPQAETIDEGVYRLLAELARRC